MAKRLNRCALGGTRIDGCVGTLCQGWQATADFVRRDLQLIAHGVGSASRSPPRSATCGRLQSAHRSNCRNKRPARSIGWRASSPRGIIMNRKSLTDLEQSHQALEDQIADAMLHKAVDDLEIGDLKRRKLQIKDEIERLRREVDKA
jgi:hypothetical protein